MDAEAIVTNTVLLGFFSAASCSENWLSYSGNCYYPSDSKANQATARTNCQDMQADLVSISDQAEMDFVESIVYELFVFVLKLPKA